MSNLPSRTEALNTLREVGCSESVINHSLLVTKIAMEIASSISRKRSVNLHLVEIGGLLHDIGRSTTHGVRHGLVGSEILEKLGYPHTLVRLARNHVGAGIPREEAKVLGLPPTDYLPTTVEEKVVCYADKLVSGSNGVTFEEALKSFESLGPRHPAIARFRALHQELVELTEGTINGTGTRRENSSGKRRQVPD